MQRAPAGAARPGLRFNRHCSAGAGGSVAAVVAAAAGWDEEATAAERAAGGRLSFSLVGRPRRLRKGPEEVALSGNRSWEQPGLRGSETTVLVEIC